jgi:hypothetical protein
VNQDQLLADLRREAAARNDADILRRAHASKVRQLVREAHAAGIGATQIAQEADLSRQAVYELLERQPKRQEPVLDRFVELPAVNDLRGGQEESDLREPRSGFGQDDPSLGG